MSDLGLFIVDNCINLRLSEQGSIERDDGLESAVLLSLFTDQRVDLSDLPEHAENRRGWWGDLFSEQIGDQIGSKLWTLERRKISDETVQIFQRRAEQCLEWMVDDGVAESIEVVASRNANTISFNISIRQIQDRTSRFAFLWDGQRLKRDV